MDENSASENNHRPKFIFKAISPSRVRRLALSYAKLKRIHPFNRVSEDFLIAVEIAALATMKDRIERHPSKGKTLM
jgi:hypothetical protein